MQAMIFAAGLGTRLLPLTNDKPKALVLIGGKTLLERNIEKISYSGIKKIVVNIHHFPDMMIDFINFIKFKYECDIAISDERELLLNTGGGLLHAKNLLCNHNEIKLENNKFFSKKNLLFSRKNLLKSHTICSTTQQKVIYGDNNLILLHNVDILSDIDFMDMQKEFYNTTPLCLLAVQKRNTQRYFIFNEKNELCGWTNIATKQKIVTRKYKQEKLYAFSGIHIVSKNIFNHITLKGVFSITDMYLELSKKHIIKPYIHEGKWLDVGKLDAIEKAEKMF